MTMQSLITAGADVAARDRMYSTPLDLATDETCRTFLKHHCAALVAIAAAPVTLVSTAVAHCVGLYASVWAMPASNVSLFASQLGPSFFWAPPNARAAIFA
jgi:hypothetical protein